jgi:hypothetical protein
LAVLCLYDVHRFGAWAIFALIRTHPKVLVGDQLVRNPDYRPPEQFVAAGGLSGAPAPVPIDDASTGPAGGRREHGGGHHGS